MKKRQIFPTITHSFLNKVRTKPDQEVFFTKESGEWKGLTWKAYYDEVCLISAGLAELGVETGDRVCIVSNTRIEWAMSDMAILGVRGVTVPIYSSNTPEDCAYIANHCEAKVVFVEDAKQLEKFIHIRQNLPNLKKIVVFSIVGNAQLATEKDVLTLEALKELGRRAVERSPEDLVAHNLLAATPEDLFTICYTSGTTGVPKGVALSHDALASEIEDIEKIMGDFFTDDDALVSFLPMSHIFGKVEAMAVYHFGWKVYYAESMEKLFGNIGEIRPTLLFAVPRIFEKAYVKIKSTIDESPKTRRKLFEKAYNAGKAFHGKLWAGKTPTLAERGAYELARAVVFKKIYAKFGGRLRLCIAGGAPLPREIGEFMSIIGIEILEGYGLTETTAAVTLNPLKKAKFGSIGRPLPEVAARIADDGEILIKSRKNMREYYKNPEATKEVVDEAGWFHTGDIGMMDEEGYIRITDRKKDIIVTSAGKNVAPQKIENLAKSHKYVSQIMVHGDRRNYLVALIVLERDEAIKYAKENNILFSEYPELIKNPKILALVQTIVDDVNSKLATYETIKRFRILPNEFTVDSGEMTPSLKVRRKFCSEKYRSELDSLY